jgi:hypothetical protein
MILYYAFLNLKISYMLYYNFKLVIISCILSINGIFFFNFATYHVLCIADEKDKNW